MNFNLYFMEFDSRASTSSSSDIDREEKTTYIIFYEMQDDNQIHEPPDELDGARVIKWAWSGNKPFGFLRYQDDLYEPIEIYGLAICQYDNSLAIYRFSCNKDWEVQQDSSHDSVDNAVRQLSDQYKLVTARWRTK